MLRKKSITFSIISIFPEACSSYLETSILGKAAKKKLIKIKTIDPRKFAKDKHKTVDDTPYGGGPGMVMKIEPIYKAVQAAKSKVKSKKLKVRTILFSTRGKTFTSKEAVRLAKYDNLILISGRYEGVDERVAKHIADEEISIGDYILSGGELPAMILIEAVSRHIKGVLGKEESLEENKGSYPVYTRPEVFKLKAKSYKLKAIRVPKVLLSGNHKKIEEWRKKHL
ncbi:tRNA (guanosine(37)-N1)-methyltransferase TrmD [bacterium]|nr:tRNA (guanosine(37)-N1)-methyltransferase TrmD [bacterium]|tara:strand:- start:263 stop:940 length:678 start_codon:yes stop_codon:yes gene_type:complete